MIAEHPQIADLAQWRARRKLDPGIGRVVVGFGHVLECRDPQIDLCDLEAGKFKAEIEAEQREFLELLRKSAVVALGELGQAIVGNHEGAQLSWAQVIEAEGRHLDKAKRSASR